MRSIIFFLSILLMPFTSKAQVIEIQGELKVMVMDTVNTEEQLVVVGPDGTLATRLVSTLPTEVTSGRTLESDLILANAACNGVMFTTSQIIDLLSNGYTHGDLLNFGVTYAELSAAGQAVYVQEFLDDGAHPKFLYNAGFILDSLYGKNYAGGILFYLNTSNFRGLIAAPSDQGTAEWGCEGKSIIYTQSTLLTGKVNTPVIQNECFTGGIAATICDDLVISGYVDWVLPSIDDLSAMFTNIGPGAFTPSTYWSSSEENNNEALTLKPGMSFLPNIKSTINNVRAVREF